VTTGPKRCSGFDRTPPLAAATHRPRRHSRTGRVSTHTQSQTQSHTQTHTQTRTQTQSQTQTHPREACNSPAPGAFCPLSESSGPFRFARPPLVSLCLDCPL